MDMLVGLILELFLSVPVELGRALIRDDVEPRPRSSSPARAVTSPRPRVYLAESTAEAQYVGPGYLARVGKGSHCLVCENSLESDAVSCPACATLHHQECWDYVGGCSTYGCRFASRR
jgi:hypothetical protein